MTRVVMVVLAAALALPAAAQEATPVSPGYGAKVGDRCQKGDAPPRQGLICLPAFVEIDGVLREEYEYESSHVLNARKGDSVLSAGCGLIANLLRQVDPSQQYSHAGIMVEDRYRIRHSTASVDRLVAQGAGDPAGSEGLIQRELKYAWPGTITQWSDEAFEGAFLQDPANQWYELRSFSPKPVECDNSGQLTPDTVLKPPPDVEANAASNARANLQAAATAASGIQGHYRFFGYSQPNEVLYSSADVQNHWADGTVGSVCSAFVWRSMKDAGITLEGSGLESADVTHRGAQVDSLTPDGLYVYTVSERAAAAQFIYNEIDEMVTKQIGGLLNYIGDVSDDLGNQLVNCFGFDWCGETFSTFAAQAGCDPNDRVQDSKCWLDEGPGVGRAVSPDNMLNWDAAPAGPYGYREDVHYAVGDYVRVYRWQPDFGTGTLEGTVTDTGNPQTYIPVEIVGLDIVAFTNQAGFYQMEAVPGGNLVTVKACSGNRGAHEFVTVAPSPATTTQDLDFGPVCPTGDAGKMRRNVRIHGTVKITDTEDFGSDEVDVWNFDETVTVEPNTPNTPDVAKQGFEWERCTGGEVKAKFAVTVQLNEQNLSAEVKVVSRMYESSSCSEEDEESTITELKSAPEDGSATMTYVQHNEEFGGQDTFHVNLTIDNTVAPPQ